MKQVTTIHRIVAKLLSSGSGLSYDFYDADVQSGLRDKCINAVTVTDSPINFTFPASRGKQKDFLLFIDASAMTSTGSVTLEIPFGSSIYGDSFPELATSAKYLVHIREISRNTFLSEVTELTDAGYPMELPPVRAWNDTKYASCWNGENAEERMMNMLSPSMPDSVFNERKSFMDGRRCDTAHLFLINQGDGEYSGYSPWGVNVDPSANALSASTVQLMLDRMHVLRRDGYALVLWIVADDSSSWASALFNNAATCMTLLSDAGFFDEASYVVLGLEMNEYGNRSQWESLKNALTSTGYSGKIGVHHTSEIYEFMDLGDIVLDQLEPGCTKSEVERSISQIVNRGFSAVGFEYERHADRTLAHAALDAGAIGVGNW